MDKKCFKCEEVKPFSEFYKHAQMKDGYLGKCKKCAKSDVKKHRTENIDRIRQYDRARGYLPHRKEKVRKYAQTPAGKKSQQKGFKKYNDKHPLRRAVMGLLGSAIRAGRIEKPDNCSKCGSNGMIHGHHEDYYKPLEVIWLCPKCHSLTHKEKRKAND